MPIMGGGGGGGGGVTPPVTITGTDPATTPLTVKGAAGQSSQIFRVRSADNSSAIFVAADSASGLAAVGLAGPNFGGLTLNPASTSVLSADTHVTFLSGSATGGFILSAFNAAPADAALAAGDMALWFDQTNGAAKLMVKAKQANGTVVSAAVALS
jgi:hypothetical protein